MSTENHHLFQRNGLWWIRFSRHARQVRISTKSRDVEVARRARDEILGLEVGSEITRRASAFLPPVDQATVPAAKVIDGIARAMYKRAKSRAKTRKKHFLLTIADVRMLLERSGWRCAVSGIPFEVRADYVRWHGPFKPSLDRIDSAKPYALSNVRVVCCIANLAMNRWGTDPLHRLAAAVMRHATGHTT